MEPNPLSASETSVLIFAMRYALARQTTAPGIVAGEIKKHWPRIAIRDREQIKNEIRNALGDIRSMMDTITWLDITKLPDEG